MGDSTKSPAKKVLVSGCFDLLHAGHVRFFETAAAYGDLTVCLGADDNIMELKRHAPHFTQEERRYMVGALATVHKARISGGWGYLDYEPDLDEIRPDFFVVNEDGDRPEKRELAEKYGVEYVVLPRTPREGLPVRSSTAIKEKSLDQPPFRLCLAGGWIDQPWVSGYHRGSAITVQMMPDRPFMKRAGLATSTRDIWSRIWHTGIMRDDHLELARLLFGYENPPGSAYVSGSQDAIGLTHPGVNRLEYDGDHWPDAITTDQRPETGAWLQDHLVLVPMWERYDGYDPLSKQRLAADAVRRLGQAGDNCWQAIQERDLAGLGDALTNTHNAWREILPLTTSPEIDDFLNGFNAKGSGRITSGCGGGYMILATELDPAQVHADAFRPTLRFGG